MNVFSSLVPGADSAASTGCELTRLQSAATITPSTPAHRTVSMLLCEFAVEFLLVLFALKTCQEGAARWAKCT